MLLLCCCFVDAVLLCGCVVVLWCWRFGVLCFRGGVVVLFLFRRVVVMMHFCGDVAVVAGLLC